MRIKRFFSWLITITLLLTLTACNLPANTGGGAPDIAGTVAAEVVIAQAQTMVALTLRAPELAIVQAAQTMVAQTLGAGNPAAPVVAANTIEGPPQDTATPTLTPTITETPTPTMTLTPEGVTLVVSQDTNCRDKGPYTTFPIVVTVKAGQVVEVVARNPTSDSYYVKNPYQNGFCWMYGKYATLTGNTAGLSVATAHPTPTPTFTPTPALDFSVSYVRLETCMGFYALRLYVKNTGGVIWQYEQITGSDSDTGFVISHSSNIFKEWNGCSEGITQSDLTPGEESFILNINPGEFGYDPTGGPIFITVKLCSLDNGAGSCLSKDLTITP